MSACEGKTTHQKANKYGIYRGTRGKSGKRFAVCVFHFFFDVSLQPLRREAQLLLLVLLAMPRRHMFLELQSENLLQIIIFFHPGKPTHVELGLELDRRVAVRAFRPRRGVVGEEDVGAHLLQR